MNCHRPWGVSMTSDSSFSVSGVFLFLVSHFDHELCVCPQFVGEEDTEERWVSARLWVEVWSLVTSSVHLCKTEHWFIHLFLSVVGFEVPDKFVVGYALDYNEYFRDLNVSIFDPALRGFVQHVLVLHHNSLVLFSFSTSALLVKQGKRSIRHEEHFIIIF